MKVNVAVTSQFGLKNSMLEVEVPTPPPGFALGARGLTWQTSPTKMGCSTLSDGRVLEKARAVEFTDADGSTVRIAIESSPSLIAGVNWWRDYSAVVAAARDEFWRKELASGQPPDDYELGDSFI